MTCSLCARIGIHLSGTTVPFLAEGGTIQRLTQRSKDSRGQQQDVKGKVEVLSNQDVSQNKLDKVKATPPES